MHPLVIIALGVAGYVAYRWISSQSGKPTNKSKNADNAVDQTEKPSLRDAEDLEPDPETGIYQAKKIDEN